MTTLNERAYELCNALVADAQELGIGVSTLACGTRIIDCGVKAPGSVEAGLQLAEVCLAGLGRVALIKLRLQTGVRNVVCVESDSPVAACMASQYAGWKLKGKKFLAIGSGPMRAAACQEELFRTIGCCEKPRVVVGILETNQLPPDTVCAEIAKKCEIPPSQLTLCVARTASQAGTLQIVARSVETALHKLHELEFDLSLVDHAWGTAPLPPVANDDLTANGWTNDAILYGGHVHLTVHGEDDLLHEIGPKVPSSASPDFGQPFGMIFDRFGGDFYRIDPMLFSPASITFENTDTGSHFTFGSLAPQVLQQSFAKDK